MFNDSNARSDTDAKAVVQIQCCCTYASHDAVKRHCDTDVMTLTSDTGNNADTDEANTMLMPRTTL